MNVSTHTEQALDLHPWPIAVIDVDGRLTFANAAFAGWWKGAGRGDRIDRVFQAQPQLLDAVRAALAGESPTPVMVADDTRRVTYRICLQPLTSSAGERTAVAVYAEPAESYADRDRAERITTLDTALYRIIRLAYSSERPSETLNRMVEAIVTSGVADSAVIYVSHNGRWFIRHASGLQEDLVGHEATEGQIRPSLMALKENKVIVINDTASVDAGTQEWLSRMGICAMMDAKLDVPWGDLVDVAIHYHSPSIRKFNDDDKAFLERVTSAMGLALRAVGLIDELRKQVVEKDRILEELRRSQRQVDAILENIPVSVFVLDADLRLMRAKRQL